MAVPFIGWWGERRDRKVSDETPTSGAPIAHRLLEEEAMRQHPFKGEMKRRQ
jgi:hypothetical protein